MNEFTIDELQKLIDWCASRGELINTVDFLRAC